MLLCTDACGSIRSGLAEKKIHAAARRRTAGLCDISGEPWAPLGSNPGRFHDVTPSQRLISASAVIACIAAKSCAQSHTAVAFASVFNFQRFGRSARSCTRYRATSAS